MLHAWLRARPFLKDPPRGAPFRIHTKILWRPAAGSSLGNRCGHLEGTPPHACCWDISWECKAETQAWEGECPSPDATSGMGSLSGLRPQVYSICQSPSPLPTLLLPNRPGSLYNCPAFPNCFLCHHEYQLRQRHLARLQVLSGPLPLHCDLWLSRDFLTKWKMTGRLSCHPARMT